ncbi:MAG TPA: xanthine dehydrogenase [Mesotoga infera]|uniref:Xanthine dehydrogenase n=1 Tax=Mesotoga infera TaxID=1236046 RepID=A0A7C1CXJ1_9BACT|nr:xanthine dehydrogenase [Mesotoga infera]
MSDSQERVVGRRIKRVDALEKVDGRAKFAADVSFDRQVYCALVIAKKAHGILKSIDASAAIRLPGIEGVFTWKDIPGENQLGDVIKDMPCLVKEGEKIRFYGDVVAVVAAKDKKTAEEAADLVKVEVEELRPVLTIEDALKDEVLVHGKPNIGVSKKIRKGNASGYFENSEHVFEGEFYAHYQEQAYMETQGVTVVPDIDYGFTVYGTMQCPYYVQGALSHVLGLPMSRIRVIQTETGGAFGGKEDVPSYVAAYAAVASYNLKRPAKLIYSREIDIQTTSKRHPVKSYYKVALEGKKIKAMQIKAYMDMGAYATLTPIVMFRTLVHAAGAYEIENVDVDVYAVYTNKIPPGAFRGFGSPQVLFAVESMLDDIAFQMGFDPMEFREINTLKRGSRTSTDHLLLNSVGAPETLSRVKKASNWQRLVAETERFNEENDDFKRGVGVSHIFYGVSLGAGGQVLDKSGAHVLINRDGSVEVRIGGTEMGQGAKTVIAIMAAEELGQSIEKILVHQPDTAFVPDSGPTVASRTTIYSGNAVRSACIALREKLIGVFCEITGSSRAGVKFESGYVYDDGGKRMRFDEIVEEAYKRNFKLFETGWYETPKLSFDMENGIGEAYVTYSYASQVVQVEVDLATGSTKVLKAFTAHDVGKSVNPEGVIGQIQGGFAQGMGYAIYEDLKHRDGRIISDNFNTYIIPTVHEVPSELVIDVVEDPFPEGPYGAKGIGEPSLMPVPASVANAVSMAIGKRVRRIPVTPEYVLSLIEGNSSNSV